ncbi:MAG: hypothetical protein ABI478_03445 [Propionivibrio sp.]
MGKRTCLRLLRALLAGLALAGFATLAGASVTVCVDPGKLLTLRVSFKAWFENAVIVSDSRGQDLAGFNNYFGRGAGGEWQFGTATWRAPKAADRRCYIIAGRHKAGPPNPTLPWRPSACRVSGMSIGFEDGGSNGKDSSYDDARVAIRGGYVGAITAPCRAAAENRANAPPKKHAEPNTSPPATPAQRSAPMVVERQAAQAAADELERKPTAARNGGTSIGETTGAGAGIGTGTGSASVAASFKLPEFPFPPPDSSARLLIPNALLTGDNPAPTFGSVATRMQGALVGNGYATLSYFAVPGGFALVTQLERINADATPAAEQRWNVAVAPVSLKSFSLEAYLRALLQKDAGYFRVIAFVFTDEPFSSSGQQVPVDEAMQWIDSGANTLPHEVATRPYAAAMVCTALVYEFEIHTHGASAELRKPSPHDGADHLRASGILTSLGQ